jgi:protein-S-isoprenylcysteine O-methyltransferase Ste14
MSVAVSKSDAFLLAPPFVNASRPLAPPLYGVVARKEAYLERRFGDFYRGYHSRVRRWL